MIWNYTNTPSIKIGQLHQDAFALAFDGSASASNVAVQTIV